jgi:hypothetical protein
MSMNQSEMNPNWVQPQAPRRGCGLLGCLLVGCGGVMLLCCGFGVWAIFYVRSWAVTDPQQVAAEAKAIGEVEPPADLKPKMAIRVRLPFYGRIASGVVYSDEGSGTLFLLSIDSAVVGAEESDIQERLQEALQQEGSEKEEDLQIESKEEKQLTVRGKPVTFSFARGKNTKTGQQLIEVKGTFEGKSGPTIFYFIGDAEKYDEETLTQTIESIK